MIIAMIGDDDILYLWYCKRKLGDILEDVRQKWNNVDKESWFKREQKLKRLEQGMICNDMRANMELGEHLMNTLPLLRKHNEKFLKEKYQLSEAGTVVKVGKVQEPQTEVNGAQGAPPKRKKGQVHKKKKAMTRKNKKKKPKKVSVKGIRRRGDDDDVDDGDNEKEEDKEEDDEGSSEDEDGYTRHREQGRRRNVVRDRLDEIEDDMPAIGDDRQEKYQELLNNNINEQLDKKKERNAHHKGQRSEISQMGDSNQTLFADDNESSDESRP
ncbi:bromodomain adjacent to zinc finger domain protein [Reticulomyxa filosa]|uniref:Bromodomain adjacent to zinc finger domain protein n=1 Tax=Reticulomyxa filosa TaxID=46433 RepID=X6MVR2_RETFI|nr:bromodomain adjacent to zinc finger domain protein [Reticulomyxa filosa]|eukprot:ETO17547.1 bromodomain adjacent to zinc finger domain protein [Reticulomyxa filosa]